MTIRHHSFWPLFLAILPWFLVVYAPFDWAGNEEHYFQLALMRVMPAHFPAFDAIFDAGSNKIITETLIGSTIAAMGYEGALIVWRLALAVITAASMANLALALGLSAPVVLGGLSLSLVLGPDILGGEGLFGTVEGKSFAYPVIFWAWATVSGGGIAGRPV